MTSLATLGWVAAPLPAGVVGGFTTRYADLADHVGGDPERDSLNLADHVGDEPERVAANRQRVARALDAELRIARQVHGATTVVADDTWPAAGAAESQAVVPEADAVVTTTPGLAVAVVVADCVPVLLADPVAGVVAAIHAGRPGLAAGVVRSALDTVSRLGGDPARSYAVLGPAICGRCYEVPDRMRDDVAGRVPQSWSTTRWGTAALDLPAGVTAQLTDAGVRVTDLGLCTLTDDRFFSHRREAPTGRFAGVIRLAR